jgi:hypothetical protein
VQVLIAAELGTSTDTVRRMLALAATADVIEQTKED